MNNGRSSVNAMWGNWYEDFFSRGEGESRIGQWWGCEFNVQVEIMRGLHERNEPEPVLGSDLDGGVMTDTDTEVSVRVLGLAASCCLGNSDLGALEIVK
jgi:hypothetical protein